MSAAEKELLRHLQMPWKLESFQALALSLGLAPEATNNLLQILKQHQFLREFSAGFGDTGSRVTSLPVHPTQTSAADANAGAGLKVLLEVLNLESPEDALKLAPFLTTAADLLLISRQNTVLLSYSGTLAEKNLPGKLQALLSKETVFVPDLVISVSARNAQASLPHAPASSQAEPVASLAEPVGGLTEPVASLSKLSSPTDRINSPWVRRAQMWQEKGVPLLAVGLWADTLQVGPLVKPADAPCLKCLDLFESQCVARPREEELPCQLSKPANLPASQLSKGAYPQLAAARLVLGAALVAAACEHLLTAQCLLPGEVRYVDEDLLIERTLWPFNPQCDNHPLALPAV
ncbi:MAG: hypothetical protein Q4D73_03485 [Actinomycetaceae bacterium]|nr:hypothetical protein [Actinomycetaceae bacterium]